MFIGNFQGTYERSSTAETLKTIKQKHDESLWDIEIINAFCDKVSDIKMIEEIALKKPKTVVDLLTVVDVCIDASET
jgi:hypothetical protein